MLRRLAPLAISLAVACSSERPPRALDAELEAPIGTVATALTDTDPVSLAVSDSCVTWSVKGLATQLVDEIQCIRPGALSSIDATPGLTLGGAVFPWLQTPARQALLDAQRQRGSTMTINSALRTLPQQYLLYRWYQTKRCGIGLAASPGTSNHEAGLAVDIEDNAGWRTAMTAHSFKWLGASDPVHYDFTGSGQVDISGLSVLAFQRLWNRNHPEDRIPEDSAYGTSTEQRLVKSPIGGFAKGADCNSPPPGDAGGGGDGGTTDASAPAPTAAADDGGGCTVASTTRSTAPRTPFVLAMMALALFALRRRSHR